MNKNLLVIFAFLIVTAIGSSAQDYYWVAFTNKDNTSFSLASPEEYLSTRAIERRIKQNIKIDSLDLPVNSEYISEVLELGAEFVHASKWLNGITVKANADSFAVQVIRLPFVKEIQLTKPKIKTKSYFDKFNIGGKIDYLKIDSSLYGLSVFQTAIINGQFLHNQNFKGQGKHIAVLDAGFFHADKYYAFDSLWANQQILGTRDFVQPDSEFFRTHYHGMSVLSCMGGNVPGHLIGTSPKASFWLLRSEDTGSEYLIEEDNWVAAAEFADSVGVDLINSSLGYYMFDDPAMNHAYSDMDGNTTRVTQGANIAASRGILVFSSAGNSGGNSWKYINAPSDGDRVIAVGAVNRDSIPASFTSYGPAYGGKIKPNVSALGWNTYMQKEPGSFGFANGTSFSSPVMAGIAACLWQAFPNATALDVKNAIEKSANRYDNPDERIGYGIPDMKKAFQYLTNLSSAAYKKPKQWIAYPNPVNEVLFVQNSRDVKQSEVTVEIFSIDGKLLRSWVKPDFRRLELRDLESLPVGILILKIGSADYSESFKLSKIR